MVNQQNNFLKPLLEIKNIKRYFPFGQGFLGRRQGFVRAVDNVSLLLQRGESIGLIGESGSGKTTLGRIMMKLIPFDAGKIYFDGEDITSYSLKKMQPIRKKMQMVFQDPFSSLDPRFSIRRVISEALLAEKGLSKKEKERRIEEVLSFVNLTKDVLEYFPHEFSGGERQRIAIARALVMKPSLLILDEAVSSLDVLVQGQIIKLLMGLREKLRLTYLFISHNLRVVKKISTRMAVMHRGKIVEWGPTQAIVQNPLHPYTKNLLSAAMDYRIVNETQEWAITDSAQLQDKGGGHFVLI